MKVLIYCPKGRTFDAFFDRRNISFINRTYDTKWYSGKEDISAEDMRALADGCNAYVTVLGSSRVDELAVSVGQSLRAVVHLGGNPMPPLGLFANERGLKIISGAEYYAASAAEGTLAYILATLRRIPEYSMRMKYKNEWRHSWDTNGSLIGKTVGLVNYSPVSLRLAKILAPFEVELLMYDRFGIPEDDKREYRFRQAPLDKIFASSDIITVHTPRYLNYYHMIDFAQLSKMKRGAMLVDTSIGGIVNQNALFVVLNEKRIFAVIDVFENEPPESDNIFLHMPNVMLMPHMAGPTPEIRRILTRKLIEECAEYIDRGKPLAHEVKYYKNFRADENIPLMNFK